MRSLVSVLLVLFTFVCANYPGFAQAQATHTAKICHDSGEKPEKPVKSSAKCCLDSLPAKHSIIEDLFIAGVIEPAQLSESTLHRMIADSVLVLPPLILVRSPILRL